jgi:hypothetical protein
VVFGSVIGVLFVVGTRTRVNVVELGGAVAFLVVVLGRRVTAYAVMVHRTHRGQSRIVGYFQATTE